MKKVKILLGISMIVVLMAAMFAFSASAAPMSLNVSVDKTALEPGQTVKATVSMDNYETPLAGFAVTINYDADALTLQSVAPENYGATAIVDPADVQNADGKITLVWLTADFSGIASVSKLADLTFVAKEEAENVAITAAFRADGMVAPGTDVPEAILPESGLYEDTPAAAPEIDVVPEGTLGGEEPEPPVGSGSANADSTTADGYSEMGAYATYAVGDRTDMYRVEVNWGDMTFVYTEADETWDPEAHMWQATEIGVWAPSATDTNKVELKNHSSLPVIVSLSFEDEAGDTDVITGTFDKESISLDAVVGEGTGAVVDVDVAYLSLEGKFTNESDQPVTLGSVTASIN